MEGSDFVPLAGPGHIPVPRRFSVSGLGWLDEHRVTYHWTVLVNMADDGTPQWGGLVISPRPPGGPIPPDDMPRIDLNRLLDEAIKVQISKVVQPPADVGAALDVSAEALVDLLHAHDAAISNRAKQARRRRRITPQLLDDVVRLYDRSGIAAVCDELDVSERYAWKLLARAREASA
jgi:hypothetical protein